MKFVFFILNIFITISFLKGQVIISNNDMPNNNEIYRLKTKNDIGNNLDFNLTGADYVWNMTNIDFSGERQDTFVKVSSTPLIYNIYFSNSNDTARKATIATPKSLNIPLLGSMIKDVYFFYKESVNKYSEVGFGATINDIQMPIKYNSPDVWYKFPITYGSKDTSFSGFSLNIPAYGYFGESKKRINTVDGWGTLKMEGGNFPVIRIKSEIFIEDTIFYEDYSVGYKVNREETEYKWIGAHIGVPMLLVNERVNTAVIEAFDSLFMNTAFISDFDKEAIQINLFPNPSKNYIMVSAFLPKATSIAISVADILGNTVFSREAINAGRGYFIDQLNLEDLNLSKGLYLVNIKTDYSYSSLRFVIN